MKYYKVEDVQNLIAACEWRMTLAKERGGEGFVEYDKAIIDVDEFQKRLSTLESTDVSEEDELKFYYVDSIDDYWIGQRLDNFYYAKWNGKLGFVWSASRYLSWGEHVVAEDTLWKEHTYPSEPREIPFTEWIVGFMKKYGSEVSEDCVDRYSVLAELDPRSYEYKAVKELPSVVPKPKEGVWIEHKERTIVKNNNFVDFFPTEYECSNCGLRQATYFINSSLPNYCPNCGAKMKGIKR